MFETLTNYSGVLTILALIFGLAAQISVKSTFSKYSKVHSKNGTTGYAAARRILDSNGLTYVTVERVPGSLTDHFDPRSNVVRLSDSTYSSTSVGAIGVAAHECGHAIQHAKSYTPIIIRNAIFPVVNVAQTAWIWIFMAGLFFEISGAIQIGILAFACVAIFQLVTLPVEFNASSRALAIIRNDRLLDSGELRGARSVLTAAAMTYVAALFMSLVQLLRLLSSARRK